MGRFRRNASGTTGTEATADDTVGHLMAPPPPPPPSAEQIRLERELSQIVASLEYDANNSYPHVWQQVTVEFDPFVSYVGAGLILDDGGRPTWQPSGHSLGLVECLLVRLHEDGHLCGVRVVLDRDGVAFSWPSPPVTPPAPRTTRAPAQPAADWRPEPVEVLTSSDSR